MAGDAGVYNRYDPSTTFTITAGASITINYPTSGYRGDTLNVTIVGTGTHFVDGTSVADFGANIVVNSTTVADATHCTANITIYQSAALGNRNVTVVTGAENPTPDIFSVYNPRIVTVCPPDELGFPSYGYPGETVNVEIHGSHTHFVDGLITAVFERAGTGVADPNITVNSTTYVNITTCIANITIAPACVVEFKDVNVVTANPAPMGTETPNKKLNGFEVRALVTPQELSGSFEVKSGAAPLERTPYLKSMRLEYYVGATRDLTDEWVMKCAESKIDVAGRIKLAKDEKGWNDAVLLKKIKVAALTTSPVLGKDFQAFDVFRQSSRCMWILWARSGSALYLSAYNPTNGTLYKIRGPNSAVDYKLRVDVTQSKGGIPRQPTGVDTSQPVRVNVEPNTTNLWLLWVNREGTILYTALNIYYNTAISGKAGYYFKTLSYEAAKSFADDDDEYLSTAEFYPTDNSSDSGRCNYSKFWKSGTDICCNGVAYGGQRYFTVKFYGNQLDMEAFRIINDKGYAACEDRYTANVVVKTSVYEKKAGKWVFVRNLNWNSKGRKWQTVVSGLAKGYHDIKVEIDDVTGLDWGHVVPGMMHYMTGAYYNSQTVAWQNDWQAGRGEDSVWLQTKTGINYAANRRARWFVGNFTDTPGTPAGWFGSGFPAGWATRGVKRVDFMVSGVHKDTHPVDYAGWVIRMYAMKAKEMRKSSWYDMTRPVMWEFSNDRIIKRKLPIQGQLTYMEQTHESSKDLYTKSSPNQWVIDQSKGIRDSFNYSSKKYYNGQSYIGRRQVGFDDILNGTLNGWPKDGWWGYGFEIYTTGQRTTPGDGVNFYIWNQHAQFNIPSPRHCADVGISEITNAYPIAGFTFVVTKFLRKRWDTIFGNYGSFQLDDACYGTYQSVAKTEEYNTQWLIVGPYKKWSGNMNPNMSAVFAKDYMEAMDSDATIDECTIATGSYSTSKYDYSPVQGKDPTRYNVHSECEPWVTGVIPDKSWFKYDSVDNKVDLMGAFNQQAGIPTSSLENSCCYAFTWVWVAEGGNYEISVGVDDGFKCWVNGGVNGKPNYSIDTWHALEPDKYRFDVSLNEGWNSLMLKITNGVGGADLGVRWEFQFRIRRTGGGSLEKGDIIYSTNRAKIAANPIIIYDAPELPINQVDKLIKFIEGKFDGEAGSSTGNWMTVTTGNYAQVGVKEGVTYKSSGGGYAGQIYYITPKTESGYIRKVHFSIKYKLQPGWAVQILGINNRNLKTIGSFDVLDEYTSPINTLKTWRTTKGYTATSTKYVGFGFRLIRKSGGDWVAPADNNPMLRVERMLVEFHGRTTNNIIIGVDQSNKDISRAPFSYTRFINKSDTAKIQLGAFYNDVRPKYPSRATFMDYQNSLYVFWQRVTNKHYVEALLSNTTDSFTIMNASDWEHNSVKRYTWTSKNGFSCSLRFDIVRTHNERFFVVEEPYSYNNNKKSVTSKYQWTWWPMFVPSTMSCPVNKMAILAAEPMSEGEVIIFLQDDQGNIWTDTSYTTTKWLEVTDNVESVDINSSDDPTADSCTINFINEDGMWNPRKQYINEETKEPNPYYGWLPRNVWDRTPRRAYVEIGVKTIHDKDYIWKKVFTGVISGFNQSVSYTDVSVPITCLDFGQQMNKYKTPENLVWAENPIIWGDSFNDYELTVSERKEEVNAKSLNTKYWSTYGGGYMNYEVDPIRHELCTERNGAGWINGIKCYTKKDSKTKVPETQTASYCVQMLIERSLPVFYLRAGDGSFVTFNSTTKWWEFRNPNSTTSPVVKLFKWTPPIGEWFRMELRLASGKGKRGMKFTIVHGATVKSAGTSDYSYGVREGITEIPPHQFGLNTSKEARFRNPYIAESMNKTWEQVVEDTYRKGFQGLAPIYRIKIDDELWTPLAQPNVWAQGQTAAEFLDRICAINGTRWRFDEEGTFVYEQDTVEDSITTITDDDIETFDYEFSIFEYLNWVEARGGENNRTVGIAAYPESVASDGIRFELIDDSGLKSTDEARWKAKAKLYGSMADVEGGTLTTFFPRLDISARDIITVDSEIGGVLKDYYVKEVRKSFNIESRDISTEFTLKSKETELLSDIAEYYDKGVLY